MTWIGACSCGGGMRCDTEAEVVAAAQDHLAIAKATGGGDGGPLNHAVGIGQVARTAILVPSWTTGSAAAPAAPVPAPHPASGNGTAQRTMTPAEIARAITQWELRFAEEADEDDATSPKYANPYTSDPDDDEDEPGWGGPGNPADSRPPSMLRPATFNDEDDEVTRPDELPEGVVIEEPGADYVLDKKESPKPVSEEDHGSQP